MVGMKKGPRVRSGGAARAASALLAVALGCGWLVGGAPAAQAQSGDVELAYEADGPWGRELAIDTMTVPRVPTTPPEQPQPGYWIYRPRNHFGTRPTGEAFRHPVITWGNGTSFDENCKHGTATPNESYLRIFELYVSWGFVVVASPDCWVGTGVEQKVGAEVAALLDVVPGTAYTGRLDANRIAAVGHSQGAQGSIEAAKLTPLVKAVVALALPSNDSWGPVCGFLHPPEQEPCNPIISATTLTTPTFFVTGQGDTLSPQAANQAYYQQMPSGVPKARGDVEQQVNISVTPENFPIPGCPHCVGDAHNYVPGVARGYSIAWLFYRLYDDPFAKTPFIRTNPSLPTSPLELNPDWQFTHVASTT
jgi:hypothetical protein